MTSVKYEYNFLAGFYNDDELQFNNYILNLHLYINTEDDEDQQIAFRRMDFLIHDVVEKSVFVVETDTDTIRKFDRAGIGVLTINEPGPIDQIIQVTLVNKLNAIVDGKLKIFESELSSCRGGYVKYMYYITDELAENFNLISKNSRKWWNDNYPRVTPIEELKDVCNLKNSVSWSDFDLQWDESDGTGESTKQNIIPMKFPKE